MKLPALNITDFRQLSLTWKGPHRGKNLTPQHHTGTFLSCIFFVLLKDGSIGGEKTTTTSLSVQQSKIFSSSIQSERNASPWNSIPLHSRCYPPSQSPPPFTAPQTHTHTLKMRVNPIKRDGLLHAWPPFPPSASTSSDQRGGFIIW